MSLKYYVVTEISISVAKYLKGFVGKGILTMEEVLSSIKHLSDSYGLGSGLIIRAKSGGMSGNIDVETYHTDPDVIEDIVDQIEYILNWKTAKLQDEMKKSKEVL